MTLTQLRTFLAVVRAGSVRGAAETLFVSEPSISAAVGALEREIGADLLERHGRGVRLTAAGEALAAHAREALGLLEQGVSAARFEARPGTGRLRLISVTTAAEYLVPALLQGFRKRHPNIEPIVEVGNRARVMEALGAREADLGIGGRPPRGREIAGAVIGPNRLVLVAARGHPLTRRREVAPADVAEETWLLREVGSGTRASAEEFLSAAGIVPRSVLTLGSNGAVKQAAAVGLGVTLIATTAVAAEMRARTLAPVRVRGLPLERPWHVLYRERARLPGPARLFLDYLRSPPARRTLGGAPQSRAGVSV